METQLKSMDDTEKYERMREEALSSWSPVDYFLACEALGVTPDNEDLYIHGALEHQRQEGISGLEKIQPDKEIGNYEGFIKEARSRGVPLNKFKWADTKKRLLCKYFPGKFSKKDLDRMSDREIGEIYENIAKKAR